jgi:hypothetical protein
MGKQNITLNMNSWERERGKGKKRENRKEIKKPERKQH